MNGRCCFPAACVLIVTSDAPLLMRRVSDRCCWIRPSLAGVDAVVVFLVLSFWCWLTSWRFLSSSVEFGKPVKNSHVFTKRITIALFHNFTNFYYEPYPAFSSILRPRCSEKWDTRHNFLSILFPEFWSCLNRFFPRSAPAPQDILVRPDAITMKQLDPELPISRVGSFTSSRGAFPSF